MDITNILNSKGAAAAAAAAVPNGGQHVQQHMAHSNGHNPADANSARANSPHGAEHSLRYSGPGVGQVNGMGGMNGEMRYPSPTAMQNSLPMLHGYRADNAFEVPLMQQPIMNGGARREPPASTARKAFDCSVCGKDFARRSDLARHERIHSGVRPHVCDYPDCGKQFIQRSALTVHARVHTGEKPHMCERCGKPFSDSSSLARHRRIHSGKRPYKCPYADCQKTFTRRTTLTRHQNHHTGTVEEAAAATAAALATRTGSLRGGRQMREDTEHYSTTGSPITTPSPGQRHMSASPNSELAPMGGMHRHTDFPYMSNISLPVHLRGEYHIPNHNQSLPTTATYSNGMPRPTSHPVGYGPPPTLEPPTNPPLSGSTGGSPHMSSVGWHSPSHIHSPTSQQPNSYLYPDPDPYSNQAAINHMYYQNSNIRRPQSTEPDSYESKPRLSELWAAAQ